MLPKIRRRPTCGILGCVAIALMALSTSASASLVLRNFDGAVPFGSGALLYVDFDTNTTSSSFFSGYDFFFQVDGSANPYALIGALGTDQSFQSNDGLGLKTALLGEGVTADASLPGSPSYPVSAFAQYAYFPSPSPSGQHYIAFRTASDLDQNPGTTGSHYGFFEVEIASLTVVGYGFESTPETGVTTTPVPEPTIGLLVFGAAGAALGLRRRKSLV